MRVQRKLLAIIMLLAVVMLAGCVVIPQSRELEEIPADAKRVMTLDLDGRSGTYTLGSIDVSGNGYMIFDVQLNSGTISAVAIRDVASDEDTCIVRRAKKAIYACEPYEYQVGSEYTFSLGNAKNVSGFIDVYFVSTYQ